MGRMMASEQYFERTRKMIKADHVDTLMLVLLEHGAVQWSAQDRGYQAETGDVLLLANHEISQSEWSAHRQTYAVLPRDLVTSHGRQEPLRRVLRSADPCAQILRHYLLTTWDSAPSSSSEGKKKLLQGLASLTGLYFGELGRSHDWSPEGHREPIKKSIERWINERLHEPDLNAEQICASFYLSRSTLYDLFKPEGGVRTYILRCRLERARALLEGADHGINIGDIARQLGFRSLSSFSRSFREHWGLTPREAKKETISLHERPQGLSRPSSSDIGACRLRENVASYYQRVRDLSGKEKLELGSSLQCQAAEHP